MDIQYLPYEPQFNMEIVHCLQRNYPWMGRRSEAEILQWASPILDYHFTLDYAYPYAHGLVVLADQHVVGFLGNITSLRDGVRTVNWTTWCVDEQYRFYTFPAIMTLLQAGDADLYTDLTASPTVQEIDSKFKFVNAPGNTVVYAVHGAARDNLDAYVCKSQEDADRIPDPAVRTAFLDHLPYDVACVIWKRQGETQYIFAKKYQRRVFYNLLRTSFVRILESSVLRLDGQEMDALLRYLAANNHVWRVECDDAVIVCADSAYVHTAEPSSRMYRSADGAFPLHWSYLYSEVALLDE